MKKYRGYLCYKESGVEWLGAIPEHWKVKMLKFVSIMNPEALSEDTSPDYLIQYLDISNVDEISAIGNNQEIYFENAPSRARRIVKDGDTIVSTVRTYLRAVVYFDNPPANQVVSTGFAVIRPLKCVYPKFLKWLILSPEFIERVMIHSEGVGYPAINPSKLARLPIWIPPLSEQRAVADFLDRETGRIDALITKYQRLMELLEEKRTSLISQAVTKGLDSTVEMKDSGVEWLGQIPEHWSANRLKYYVKLPEMKLPEKPIGAIYLGLENIESWSGRLLLNEPIENIESSVNIFNSGNVLFGKLRPYLAKVALPDFNGVSTTEILTLSPQENLESKFLFYVMLSEGFIRTVDSMTYGTKMPRANSEQVGSMIIPIPPQSEQCAIADFLDRKTVRIDLMREKIMSMITKLKEYRMTLISAAVTGKIDVIQSEIGYGIQ